jgi:hypothetical protein
MVKRDPNAPKRLLSGYFRFMGEIREDVVEEVGNSIGPVGKECASRWNALSEKAKLPYQKAALKEMAKYKIKFEKYKKTKSYSDFQAAKKAQKFAKRPKDKNAPKRSLSAYMIFNNSVRDEIVEEIGSKSDIGRIAKEVSRRWANMDEDDKAEYQAQADEAKEDYQQDLAKYQKSKKFAAYQETLNAWKQAKKNAAKADKPKVVRRRR